MEQAWDPLESSSFYSIHSTIAPEKIVAKESLLHNSDSLSKVMGKKCSFDSNHVNNICENYLIRKGTEG